MPVDARNQALQYISLAESQIGHGQFQDALTSLNRAGELAHKAQAADILSIVYGTLGNVYQFAGRYDDALKNCIIALKIQEELAKRDPFFNVWVATTLNNLGAQLIHIFEEHEIRESKKENPGAFLKALDEIYSSKRNDEIIKLLKGNDAVIKNYSPLMHSNISGNKLDNLRFEEIKDRCRGVVIK